MKKQVIIIHGGTAFRTYKEYLGYLKNCSVSLEKFKPKRDWKNNIGKSLGSSFEILLPKMPNKSNARYKEWRIWFERVLPLVGDSIILIGHSLGGIFLAKYLSENLLPKKVIATFLIAAPFDDEGGKGKESLVDFSLHKNLRKFEKQGGEIYLYHSKDDPVVPFKQLRKYKKELPNAKEIILNKKGHINQEQFPELVKEIRNLFK